VTAGRQDGERVAAAVSEQRHGWWEAFVRLGSALVLVLDESGVILYASPSALPMLGLDPDEIVGTSAFDLVHPNDVQHVAADFVDRLEHGGPNFLTRFRVLTSSGEWRHLGAYAADVRDEPGAGAMVVHARDITPEVEADAALRNSEERFRALVQRSTDFIAVVDGDGAITYASPALERVLGYAEGAGLDVTSVFDLAHPDDIPLARTALDWTTQHTDPSPPIELRMWSGVGTWRVVELVGLNLSDDPAVGGIVVNGRDVTERHRTQRLLQAQADLLEGVAQRVPLEQTLLRVAGVVEQLLTGTYVVIGLLEPGSGVRAVASPTFPQGVVGQVRELLEGSQLELAQALREGGELEFADVASDPMWTDVAPLLAPVGVRGCLVFPIIAPDDETQVGFLVVLSPEPGAGSESSANVCRWAVHVSSVAVERRRVEDLLLHQALHDHLTGLPNRILLLDRIEQAQARGRRHGTDVAVLFIDLDQFKVINDSLGHAVGDDLLAQVARRLTRAVPDDDTVGRFGGDEFVVVGEDLDGDLGAVELAEHINAALSEPFDLSGEAVVVSASIGIVLAGPASSADPQSLVRNADAAMYRAKAMGRGNHAVFEQALHDRIVERMLLERDLRLAVEQGELVLHYQPIVRVADACIDGVEALLRWNRPEHGMVLPTDFIPAAEDTGLIVPIGQWVLGEVCRQARIWTHDPVLGKLRISANLSARQLTDPDLIEVVHDALEGNGLEPGRLVLEVTESALVDDLDVAHDVLAQLHQLGVGIAIDDFGTGWASLDYVRRFTVADELKIDGSFIADLEGGTSADEAIVSASIVLARSLGLEVVAEGVETSRQFEALGRLGCGRAQGFLFSRAVDVDALATFVAGFHWPVP
jgi:diguanylate cyclase (GGDEF)-like protein/PAS domain S-box-containing protein